MAHSIAESRTEIVRPLRILVPLIKDELTAGDAAGIVHYRRAGEMLHEAKEQVPYGEFTRWLTRNFHLSVKTAYRYMALADTPRSVARDNSQSMREAIGESRPGASKVSWQRPVQEIAARVNINALAKERQDRQREAQLLHNLAYQLIDIGFKVLAAKLHPDKGGSTEAMARLNKVRSILKGAI